MDYGRWTMDDGLWTMDDGLWTMDYGLWTEASKARPFTNYDLRITIWILARKARSSRANFENNAGCWLESVRSYAMLDPPLC